MEAPKFTMCPECEEKYDDTKKRRIIDSCGHPRCFSCLLIDNPCPICEKLLRGRSKSWISSRESVLSSTDEDQDKEKYNRTRNGSLTEDHYYLRALYSYNPGSQENVSKYLGSRRLSLDNNNLIESRKRHLGRHSTSALVLPTATVSQKPSSGSTSSKESDSSKRYTLPSLSKELLNSRALSASTQSLSSSSGIMKFFEDIIENDKVSVESTSDNHGGGSGVQSQVSSPRSSGYWSEMESYSDQEMEKNTSTKYNNNSSDKNTKTCMKELAKIDVVLSGNSSAWENTKALFQPSSSSLLGRGTRRHSAPDWHFKKFLIDMRNKHAHQTDVKVTEI